MIRVIGGKTSHLRKKQKMKIKGRNGDQMLVRGGSTENRNLVDPRFFSTWLNKENLALQR